MTETRPPDPGKPASGSFVTAVAGVADFFKSWQVIVAGIAAATSLYFSLLEKERKEFEINKLAIAAVSTPETLKALATDPYNTINRLEAAYPRHGFCAGLGVLAGERARLERGLATANPEISVLQSNALREAIDDEMLRVAESLGLQGLAIEDILKGLLDAQQVDGTPVPLTLANCARMEPAIAWGAGWWVDRECALALSVHLENLCVGRREAEREAQEAAMRAPVLPGGTGTVTTAAVVPPPGAQFLLRGPEGTPDAAPFAAPGTAAAGACANLTVFVHVLRAEDTGPAKALMATLNAKGWSVSGPDLVPDGRSSGDVRYYKAYQTTCAGSLAESVTLNSEDHPQFKVFSLEKTFRNLPEGRMELWLPAGFR